MAGCIDLLSGDHRDSELIYVLGGAPAHQVLVDGNPEHDYWIRLWGARGLLWVWNDSASAAIIGALADDSWRVREMAAKVVRRNLVGEALAAVALCQQDPILRVRLPAQRAVIHLTDQLA